MKKNSWKAVTHLSAHCHKTKLNKKSTQTDKVYTEDDNHDKTKREYFVIIRDNFCYFCIKTYVVTPHLNCLKERVHMWGHNICFYADLTKIIPNYH